MTPIFIQNKYSNWYFNIISVAKLQNRFKNKDSYFESHHIIPKCMGGIETILLTSKEHFICHLLLCKMTTGKNHRNMLFAFKCMSELNKNGERFTSKIYEYYKPKITKALSDQFSGKPNYKNRKPRSEIGKANIKSGMANSQKHKAAARLNFQNAAKKRKGIPHPEHLKKQWSEAQKGIPKTIEAKSKMKLAALERAKIRASCKYCHKELPVNSLYSHWRFCPK